MVSLDCLSDSDVEMAGSRLSDSDADSSAGDAKPLLQTHLQQPCGCQKKRGSRGSSVGSSSCFSWFLKEGWDALVSWRASFRALHKLDQDRAAQFSVTSVLHGLFDQLGGGTCGRVHSSFLLGAKLFDFLRELAIKQNVIEPGWSAGETQPRAAGQLKYMFLGKGVCKKGLATLMGVGWSPRLDRILESVLLGRRSAPLDARWLHRPLMAVRPKWAEVASYLQGLYESVAEALPDDSCNKGEAVDPYEAELNVSIPAGQADELRFLPPGSIFDQWRQYSSIIGSASFRLFWTVWKTEFWSKLQFRAPSMHTVCATCIRHRLLLRHLCHDMAATIRQRAMFDRHLESQYRDRQVYWALRASSRLRSTTLCLIIDGMDQSKFCWPRAAYFSSHEFDGFQRPRLHVWAALCHGYCSLVTVSNADTAKGGSTTCEVIAHVLTLLARSGVQLFGMDLHVQLDNTSSCNKNNTVLLFLSVLCLAGVLNSASALFLRAGHTHEDHVGMHVAWLSS